jgi:hypothetical protein
MGTFFRLVIKVGGKEDVSLTLYNRVNGDVGDHLID